ncbi:putative 2-methylcitrate dehydratase (PrpD) [Aspergillus candidus]|uniref:MmgE/PrpD family protein n=1 Tax=Aspergillus candidus TaxID=41067 RepID=A0A2I2FB42_ASPCN|nr:MmgE/PrpD family protein [Aspergillus candidus]PLB37826.1 MmgE/PrpD family protein [Aspergillus candidus]
MSYDAPIPALADYIHNHQITDPSAFTSARTALLDAIGCAIETASKSPDCRAMLAPPVPGTVVPNGFRVPGTAHTVDPVKGAFDMGTLIRYLDHNDALGGKEWGHPSDNLGAILPVMAWLAQSKPHKHTDPPLTMRTLLTALIKAYEIQGVYQMSNAFNAFGIDHVILVKLASAAATSWLLGLTHAQTCAVISHVWADGHPSRVYRSAANTVSRKGWAAGDACMRAVHLALLVKAGQGGIPRVLTARPFGFWERTFGERGFDFPRALGCWTVGNVLFKIVPVEGHAVAAVEGALVQGGRLRGREGGVDGIEVVEVRTTRAAEMIISKTGVLKNAADRDHCLQFVVALALLKGAPPEVEDYWDVGPWATSAELEALRGRVVVVVDEGLTADYLDLDKKSIGSGVTVRLRDGTVLPEVLVEYPVGHVKNPATAAAVREKFWKNMRLMFTDGEVEEVLKAVEQDDLGVVEFVDLFSRGTSANSRL